MLELSNTAAQTLTPGQAITFDKVLLATTCGAECYNRQVPNQIKMKARGIYEIHFHGNITSVAESSVLQMAIAVEGFPLVETAMNATPSAAGTLVNVGAATLFNNNCCDLGRISVINTGTTNITVAPNTAFYVVRKS